MKKRSPNYDKASSRDDNSDNETSEKNKSSSVWMKVSIFIAFLSIIIIEWPKVAVRIGIATKEDVDAVRTKAIENIYDYFNISTSVSSSGSVLPGWDEMISMINGSLPNQSISHMTDKSKRPGYKLAKLGAKAKYPVVMIPGFVTSGLEVWAGEECMEKHFRTRIWGSVNMAQTLLENKECWIRHLSLNPKTGLDASADIRIRAVQGFEAADYFISNYWVFGKLIENLADIGYDGTNMAMFGYDWRLSFPHIEERDGYLTKLKLTIEGLVQSTGEKAVLLGHSMGSPVILFFLRWVTVNGGDDWVDKHIHSVVNMAGAILGVPKAAAALLSGEMRETSQILGIAGDLLEKFFSRKKRLELFHTWGSLWALLPKGGNTLWSAAADVDEEATIQEQSSKGGSYTVSPMITITGEVELELSSSNTEMQDSCPAVSSSLLEADESSIAQLRSTIEAFSKLNYAGVSEVVSFIKEWAGGYGNLLMSSKVHDFDFGGLDSSQKVESLPIEKWHDPTVTPLPHAPNMKMYCLYGMGVPTERTYYYKKQKYSDSGSSSTCTDPFKFTDPPFIMDTDVNKEGPTKIQNGVYAADGDGSVPLLSLGYMCADGWIESPLNPSEMEIVTREYLEQAEFDISDPFRYGPRSGQHCDILGNVDFLEDVVKIVSDFGSVQNRFISDIQNIAQRINQHPFGGIKGN